MSRDPLPIRFGTRVYMVDKSDNKDAFAPRAYLGTAFGEALHTPNAYYVYRDGGVHVTGNVQAAGVGPSALEWAKVAVYAEEEPVKPTHEEEDMFHDPRALPPPQQPLAFPLCPACCGRKRAHTRIWRECNRATPPFHPDLLLPSVPCHAPAEVSVQNHSPEVDRHRMAMAVKGLIPEEDLEDLDIFGQPFLDRLPDTRLMDHIRGNESWDATPTDATQVEGEQPDPTRDEQQVFVKAAVRQGESFAETLELSEDDGETIARVVNELKESGLQPVPLRELRQSVGREYHEWRGAIENELGSFEACGAVREASEEELIEINMRGAGWTVVPAKLVAGLKPPKQGTRLKQCRIVACGNHQAKDSDAGYRLDTQQIDSTSTRILLRWAALHGTSVGTIDISTAFLHAQLPKDMKVAAIPPKLLVDWGYVKSNKTRWIIEAALYGLRVSPRLWQKERDRVFKDLTWETKSGCKRRMARSTEDPSVWYIIPVDRNGNEGAYIGMVGAHVDDIVCAADIDEIIDFFDAVKRHWPTSPPQIRQVGLRRSPNLLRAPDPRSLGEGALVAPNRFCPRVA